MKQYHYLAGTTQLGPFTLEELRAKALTPDTLVWATGLPGWVKASELPELTSLFPGGTGLSIDPKPDPQPAPLPPYQQPALGATQPANPCFGSTPKPRTWLVESILATVLCCLPFGIVGIVFASRVDTAYNAGDYAGAQKASNEAGKWTKVSFFVAIAGWVLYMLFFGAAIFATLHTNRY